MWHVDRNEEEDLRNGMMLAIVGLTLLAGCKTQGDNAPAKPKVKGPPYHIAFDTQATKPNPAGVTIPAVKYTGDPESLERRAILVVRFDEPAANNGEPMTNQMISYPVDITGTEGTLPADYMAAADKDLSRFLGTYCLKGKINISVALARSSISRQSTQADVDAKRLSDWAPVEVVYKNPHPKC